MMARASFEFLGRKIPLTTSEFNVLQHLIFMDQETSASALKLTQGAFLFHLRNIYSKLGDLTANQLRGILIFSDEVYRASLIEQAKAIFPQTHQTLWLNLAEFQVANISFLGLTAKEMALCRDPQFPLSSRTIDFHLLNIRKKLGLSNYRTSRLDLLSVLLQYGFPFVNGESIHRKKLSDSEILELFNPSFQSLLTPPVDHRLERAGYSKKILFEKCFL